MKKIVIIFPKERRDKNLRIQIVYNALFYARNCNARCARLCKLPTCRKSIALRLDEERNQNKNRRTNNLIRRD
jgi:hypothetical protein